MDQTADSPRYQRVPGTHLRSRFTWLVVVPAGFAFVPWGMFFLQDRAPEVRLATVALLPLLGLLAVPGYRWLTRDRVLLLPYLPAAAVALTFVALTFEQFAAAAFGQPGGEFLWIFVMLGLGFVQPLLTVAGGLLSFVRVSPGPIC